MARSSSSSASWGSSPASQPRTVKCRSPALNPTPNCSASSRFPSCTTLVRARTRSSSVPDRTGLSLQTYWPPPGGMLWSSTRPGCGLPVPRGGAGKLAEALVRRGVQPWRAGPDKRRGRLRALPRPAMTSRQRTLAAPAPGRHGHAAPRVHGWCYIWRLGAVFVRRRFDFEPTHVRCAGWGLVHGRKGNNMGQVEELPRRPLAEPRRALDKGPPGRHKCLQQFP